MKLSELSKREIAGDDPEITGLTADSREVKPGYLFAALAGTMSDGATFVPQAVEKGAVAVLAGTDLAAGVPVLAVAEPRLELAKMAARFYSAQPDFIAGVTGTNGKTSIARFTQQIWQHLGLKAASMGTLGAHAPGYEYKLRHTTPDPVEIHQVLDTLSGLGVSHLAMEVSSHGLAQYRADGISFRLAAFTNITRDHLDYHERFEGYRAAKARLFTELLAEDGIAIINLDGAGAEAMVALARKAGRRVETVGRAGEFLRLLKAEPAETGLEISLEADGKVFDLAVPLVGTFQAQNVVTAGGLVMASGHGAGDVLPLLAKLDGAPGRMELIARVAVNGGQAGVYVDYAHTPDALETILAAARPHCTGRIVLVFGAGGDRDTEKRPLMGKAAAKGADIAIVTDDNPRTENPDRIRREILAACPQASEISDREQAIAAGIEALQPGDMLIVAGKGHEAGQTIGDVTLPFNDGEVVRRLLGSGRDTRIGRI